MLPTYTPTRPNTEMEVQSNVYSYLKRRKVRVIIDIPGEQTSGQENLSGRKGVFLLRVGRHYVEIK